MRFTVKDRLFASANIDNVESLVFSQERKPETRSSKLHDLQHNTDFSQQDYPAAGCLLVPVLAIFLSVFNAIKVTFFVYNLLLDIRHNRYVSDHK